MANKKKLRQLDNEARQRMKIKDRGHFDNEVAGGGSMQRPKIDASQVEGRSVYGLNPEAVVIGRRTDEEVGRSR